MRAMNLQMLECRVREQRHRHMAAEFRKSGKEADARNENILAHAKKTQHSHDHARYTNFVLIHGSIETAIRVLAAAELISETAITLDHLLKSNPDVAAKWASLREQMDVAAELDEMMHQPLVEEAPLELVPQTVVPIEVVKPAPLKKKQLILA
jgi:hypothetical protein